MTPRVIIPVCLVLLLVLLPTTNVLLSRKWLADHRAEILALPPDGRKNFSNGVWAVHEYEEGLKAFVQKPKLWPFGTWALHKDGRILWLTNGDIELLKRLE